MQAFVFCDEIKMILSTAAFPKLNVFCSIHNKMTTRSTYKCCISKISLDPNEGLTLDGRIVHAGLVKSWLEAFGNECLPDGSEVPESLKEEYINVPIDNRELIVRQKNFLYEKLTEMITKALMDTGSHEWQKHFLFSKVLMAWYITVDPRGALETFTHNMELCHNIEDDGSPAFSHIDVLITLHTVALQSFLSDADIATTIDAIDQQKQSGPRTAFAGDQTLSRYISHLSTSSPELVQYIIGQRLL